MQDEDYRSPVSKLIWEVSQKPILYDPHHNFYKDNPARQAAWRQVADKMRIPVTDCQIKWSTLRRCLANARKRQMRRQAVGSKSVKKWRYQDEMAFLLPFIDRKEYEYMNISRKNAQSVEYEDLGETSLSQDMYISEEYEPSDIDECDTVDVKPRNKDVDLFTVENVTTTESPVKDRNERSSNITVDHIFIGEDEIEQHFNPEGRPWMSSTRRNYDHDVTAREVSTSELLLDEMDTFFLSMSKALKKLPPLEQIKARSQVYNIVTRIETSWLQNKPSDVTADNSKQT